VSWDVQAAGVAAVEQYGTPLPQQVVNSIKKNGVALKGPLTTPIGTGFRSANVALRKSLDLYAGLRPCRTLPGVPARYDSIDLAVVRENTEDLYAGRERMIDADTAESIKLITRRGSERIVRFACGYALRTGRKKVTVAHKANIMKCTDGLFLETARSAAREYPGVEFEEVIVDALCMKLVTAPEQYDVLVMPNLYGDIISDLCSGLVGGLGLAPGANIGPQAAVFEPVHGSAPELAGRNCANPAAAMRSAALMLDYLGETEAGARLEQAVLRVLSEECACTADLGGCAGTDAFADAVVSTLQHN
jgi:isocitrate dehydrogenase (NAD+)